MVPQPFTRSRHEHFTFRRRARISRRFRVCFRNEMRHIFPPYLRRTGTGARLVSGATTIPFVPARRSMARWHEQWRCPCPEMGATGIWPMVASQQGNRRSSQRVQLVGLRGNPGCAGRGCDSRRNSPFVAPGSITHLSYLCLILSRRPDRVARQLVRILLTRQSREK